MRSSIAIKDLETQLQLQQRFIFHLQQFKRKKRAKLHRSHPQICAIDELKRATRWKIELKKDEEEKARKKSQFKNN